MVSKMNKRGTPPLTVTILVIGVVLVCCLAIYTFFSSEAKTRGSFVGLRALEKMNSQIEENYFYKQSGTITGTQDYADIYSVINYAKENNVNGRTCNCKDKCTYYALLITNAANENGIPDPLLLLSLIMQESFCESTASSGSSVGLMQINLIHCGEYELPSNKEECKNQLIKYADVNVDVGAKILKASYDSYKDGKIFNGCSNRNVLYTGWEAALRGYNGWGCGKDAEGNLLTAQDRYVEEVMDRYNKLKEINTYVDVIGKGGFFLTKEKFVFSAKYTEQ